ncbi:MAG: hypothetical protein IPJ06_13415 [Saprospiraceae bacterium]|nr:hypothetical protein [Saprospiraceae bacterium]
MENERIVILGGGESGVAAAVLAQTKGYVPFVSDEGTIGAVFKEELLRSGIEFEEGGHFSPILQEARLVIKSPGIPGDHILVRTYRDRQIPVLSEIEFASRFISGRIVGITGTNGKTTTTHLVHHFFQHAGLSVGCGGNIGHALARLAMETPRDWYILELSSFQLDDIQQFHPTIAILLNVTPDHLDRYDNNMSAYARAKLNLVRNQTSEDVLILQQGNHYIDRCSIRLRSSPEYTGSINRKVFPGNGLSLRVTGTICPTLCFEANTICSIRLAPYWQHEKPVYCRNRFRQQYLIFSRSPIVWSPSVHCGVSSISMTPKRRMWMQCGLHCGLWTSR